MKILLPLFLLLHVVLLQPIFLSAASLPVQDPQSLLNKEYYDALQKGIRQAKEEIILSFFLFKISDRRKSLTVQLEKSLKEAVRRGVRVIVLLEKSKHHDITFANEKSAKTLRDDDITVFFDAPQQVTHTKVVIIDRSTVFLGSHNLTESALRFNNEASIRLHSGKMAHRLLEYLDRIHPGILTPAAR